MLLFQFIVSFFVVVLLDLPGRNGLYAVQTQMGTDIDWTQEKECLFSFFYHCCYFEFLKKQFSMKRIKISTNDWTSFCLFVFTMSLRVIKVR